MAFWNLIWNFLNSTPFEWITISFLLPIILAIIEGFFEFRKLFHERIQLNKQKRIDKQYECLEKTEVIWNNLFGLVTEVIYFNLEEKEKEKRIQDWFKKSAGFTVDAEELVNMWHFRFTNLTGDDTLPFIIFINVLKNSASTIIKEFNNINNTNRIIELQETLAIIKNKIKNIIYHPMNIILKNSIELKIGDIENKSKLKNDIDFYVAMLKNWAAFIKDIEHKENKLFSGAKGKDINRLRKEVSLIAEWLALNKEKDIEDYEGYQEFFDFVGKIPKKKLIMLFERKYPLEFVEILAHNFARNLIFDEIHDRRNEYFIETRNHFKKKSQISVSTDIAENTSQR
ncbi:MAG: hypothetical protein ACTSQN_12820 [Candidatus Heimdallarchaeota archaeon]